MIKSILSIATLVLMVGLAPMGAQGAAMQRAVYTSMKTEIHTLRCQGQFLGWPAMLVGQRQYIPYNEFGDGQVEFQGMLSWSTWRLPIQYQDYTNLAPYDGFLIDGQQLYSINVLDNTGGRFIIYDGRSTLGPPEIWGEFSCRWS
jgi:hypothetical protein